MNGLQPVAVLFYLRATKCVSITCLGKRLAATGCIWRVIHENDNRFMK